MMTPGPESPPNAGQAARLPGETFFAKLVVVGECGVGKTSLLRAFCDEDYSPSYVTTIGVDFRIMTVHVGGANVKLHIWDTAGQERYKSLTSSYFRGAMGILVCYDCSSAVSQTSFVRRWMDIIDKSADGDPVVMLVGTKLDKCQAYNGILNEQYEEVMSAGEQLADELQIPHTLTSSMDNINVKTPFVDILHILKDQGKLRRSTVGASQGVSGSKPDIVYLNGEGRADGEDNFGAARKPGGGEGTGAQPAVVGTKKALACSCKACAC